MCTEQYFSSKFIITDSLTIIMHCSESFELVEWDKRKPVIAIHFVKIVYGDRHDHVTRPSCMTPVQLHPRTTTAFL